MHALRPLLLVLACAVPLSSCGTFNLVKWAQDKPSVYAEPQGEVSRGFLKPVVTVVGFPVAVVWDVLTFPFQIIGGVYPYSDSVMEPETRVGI